MVSVEVKQEVTFERISDLMCSAIEGGSTYWCHDLLVQKGPTLDDGPWYSLAAFWESDYELECRYDLPEQDEGPEMDTKS